MTHTVQEARKQFRLRGISVAQWARQHGFNPTLVYQVLRSENVPARGQSHKIAVALGLKEGFMEEDLSLLNQDPSR